MNEKSVLSYISKQKQGLFVIKGPSSVGKTWVLREICKERGFSYYRSEEIMLLLADNGSNKSHGLCLDDFDLLYGREATIAGLLKKATEKDRVVVLAANRIAGREKEILDQHGAKYLSLRRPSCIQKAIHIKNYKKEKGATLNVKDYFSCLMAGDFREIQGIICRSTFERQNKMRSGHGI